MASPPAAAWQGPSDARGVAVCVTTALFVILTGGFLAMRAIHKYQAPYAKYALDDLLLAVAMLLFLAQSGLLLAGVKYGYGEHLADATTHHTPGEVALALKLPVYAQVVASFALCFAKLSVGATLLHLCRGVTYLDRRLALTYKVLIVIAIVLAVMGNVMTVAFILTGCCPGEFRSSVCNNVPVALAAYLQLASNLAVNLLFVFSTMWLLRRLKLGSRDRLAIDLLLCFMFSASITSIVKAVKGPQIVVNPSPDLTWEVPVISILLSAEICLSIMAACLPSIRRVLGRHFPSHWLFWQSGDDDGLDLVAERVRAVSATGSLDVAAPPRMRQNSVGDGIEPVVTSDKSEWGQINMLEEGIKPIGGDSSVDEISNDEKNREMSLEHFSERGSERNASRRSSARFSWPLS